MKDAYNTLNRLLVKLFNNILTYEEKALITEPFHDISLNDMHVIEAIGIGTKRNMSSIAKDLEITVGTLTIAMNNLVKKGYVKRTRSSKDRRVVLVSLSDTGVAAFNHHQTYHEKMIEGVMDRLSEDQLEVLCEALDIVHDYIAPNDK